MEYTEVHGKLGHIGTPETIATAKQLGWKLNGKSDEDCESCSVGKAKQKVLP